MARFIPIDKLMKLREAAKNGDEKAKIILRMQMNGEDFGSSMDEYFQPKEVKTEIATSKTTESLPQKKSKLDEFLEFNNITKDSPDYDSFVEDFYREFPNEKQVGAVESEEDEFEAIIKDLMKDETDAIEEYSKAITKLMPSEQLDEVKKRRVIARLKEIRDDEEQHFAQLGELLKKDEPEIGE